MSTLLAFSLKEAWGDSEHLTTASLFSKKYDSIMEKFSSAFLLKIDSRTQIAFMRT
jgi:hypothetical protein